MSKEQLTPPDSTLREKIIEEFILVGNHQQISPINVANRITREPLFITAGIQILDPVIHNDEEPPNGRLLVFQPSVRLKALPTIDNSPANFSSFINIASLAVNTTPEEHHQTSQGWIEFLKELNVPNISLSTRTTQADWGTGIFHNDVTDIFSGEIHIGDAVFRTDVPQNAKQSINISDISFGYERIMLSLGNKNKMFDLENRPQMDLERTLTLILGSGITPGNKLNIGRKIQSLIKGVDYGKLNHETILDLQEWWSQFTHLPIKPYRIYDIISEAKFNSR